MEATLLTAQLLYYVSVINTQLVHTLMLCESGYLFSRYRVQSIKIIIEEPILISILHNI